MVYFVEKNHKYFNEHGAELSSVSKVMKKYLHNFDEDVYTPIIKAFRMYCEDTYQYAKKKHKWYEKEKILEFMIKAEPSVYEQKIKQLAESLKEKWNNMGEEASEYGTMEHSKEEEEALAKGFLINPIDGMKYRVIPRAKTESYDNSYIMDEVLKMKENVCVLEGLIADESKMICGQEDRIYLKYMGAGFFHGMNHDFKTDKILKDKSMWIKNDIERMKNELHYFNTSNLQIYTIKMSLYGVLLENTGKVKVVKNYLEHIPRDKERKFINLLYYKNYAKLILDNYTV